MDFDEICLMENFDQFQFMNLLSPNNSDSDLNATSELKDDQHPEIIDNLELYLNSHNNNEIFATNDSINFDNVTLDDDLMNQMFYDNASPSTSDSGNYSPTCSTSDEQNAAVSDPVINIIQTKQMHQLETKYTVAPNPSCLVPVQIPLQQIVASGNSGSSQPMICIMSSATNANSLKSQEVISQNRQRILSPKHEVPSPAPKFAITSIKDYDRKKEDRKIRNRYSAQLSRIRKKNEINEMKRNLANKDVVIEKLKNEIGFLKKTVETLRRENELLKSASNVNKNNNGRLGMLAGTVCLFGFVSLLCFSSSYTRNLNPIHDATSSFALKFRRSIEYSSQEKLNVGRNLLSMDYYDEDLEVRKSSQLNKKSNALSQSNLSYSTNCDSVQNKDLNKTEAIKLNNDVFAWINRHECLQFMHIRHIFRVPINRRLKNSKITESSEDSKHKKMARMKNHQQRTANDKIEAARLKAIRERAWRHIDMISSSADNTAIKSQVKAMDYNVMGAEHSLTNWMQDKPDVLATSDMELQYAELVRNLKQREDTLYIVAMKNYYLLPATDRNSTLQPRMALILPALSFNGTLSNQVAMMRLECHITGTGLFHLPSSLLPLFYDHGARQ